MREMKRFSKIKEALCALCRILSFFGCILDPETFRKAKFNRPEAAPEFWKLLYCLLKQIYSNDISSISRSEKGIKENEIIYVKSILLIRGYGRRAFYELPDDGTNGSREALLAFSWLLHTGKILEVILENRSVHFGDHISFCTCSHMDFKPIKDSRHKGIHVRYLQWLNGKLQLYWRNLHTVHLEKCCMLYKIHLYTQGCQIDKRVHHLSAMEIDLINHPENCYMLLQRLKSEDSYLETYLEWSNLKTVYWQWMETVFKSALDDECITSAQKEINLCTSFTSKFKPPSDLHLTALHNSLSDVHDQIHDLFKYQKLTSSEQLEIHTGYLRKLRRKTSGYIRFMN